MSVENEDMTTRKQVIEPQTGMSTPRKVSLSESGHECQVISGSRSVLGLGTYHQYLYMIEYGRKDQWNFRHYWQCPISKIIAKAFKYTMEGILEKNWTNLYPEAEEVIPYTPTGISVESVPERSHNRGIGMGGTKYTPGNAKNSQQVYILKKYQLEHSLIKKKMTMVEDDDWKEVWINGGTTRTMMKRRCLT